MSYSNYDELENGSQNNTASDEEDDGVAQKPRLDNFYDLAHGTSTPERSGDRMIQNDNIENETARDFSNGDDTTRVVNAENVALEEALPAYVVGESARQEQQHNQVIKEEDVQAYVDRRKLSKAAKMIVAILLLILLGAVLGLSLGLTRKRSAAKAAQEDDESNDTVPSAQPTISPGPSISPTEFPTTENFPFVATDIATEFGEKTYQVLQQQYDSPQAKAARWISQMDPWFTFPLSEDDAVQRQHFRQRFALATLFYSTGGEESWVDHIHFLSNLHECDWSRFFIIYRGVSCNDIPSSIVTAGSLESSFNVTTNQRVVVSLSIPENNLTGMKQKQKAPIRAKHISDLLFYLRNAYIHGDMFPPFSRSLSLSLTHTRTHTLSLLHKDRCQMRYLHWKSLHIWICTTTVLLELFLMAFTLYND